MWERNGLLSSSFAIPIGTNAVEFRFFIVTDSGEQDIGRYRGFCLGRTTNSWFELVFRELTGSFACLKPPLVLASQTHFLECLFTE